MNLRPALFLPLLSALSACMMAAPEASQSPAISTMSAPEIVLPEGGFLYACAVRGVGTTTDWRFSIVEQENETGSEILMETLGVNAAYPLDRRSGIEGETFVAGNDRIIISPDNSVTLFWAGASSAPNYTGQCQKGTPA
ncbi:MAG: hypothetical protein P8X76_01035 [Maritimibacter sp.]